MAERNIAFTIRLNGVDQVFSSIAELEESIRRATEELRTFTGSEADFKKLQDEIKGANNELNKIREGTKGLSVEKQVGEFLKLGQVVVGAFGAATTALSLFGIENEKVADAAAKAQQILTLQYSLVTLAKEKDTIVTAANTVATIVNTAATQGLRAAMTLLFATMRANPFGALLTIIGLVAGAITLLTGKTKDAEEQEKSYQQTLERTRATQANTLRLLESAGAGSVLIAREKLKIARTEEETANRAFLRAQDTNRFSEETEKARIEADKRRVDRIVAENDLDRAIKQEQLEREEELNRTREENERRRLERLEKAREVFEQSIQREIEFFRKLNVELRNFPEPNFLTQLQAALKETESQIEQFEGKSLDEIIQQFFGDVQEQRDNVVNLEKINAELKLFGREAQNLARGLTPEGKIPDATFDAREELNILTKGFLDLKSIQMQRGELTQDEFKTYQDIFKVIKNVSDAINGIPSLAGILETPLEGEEGNFFDALRNFLIGEGDLKFDLDAAQNITKAIATQTLSEAKAQLNDYEKVLKEFLRREIKNTDEFKELRKSEGIANIKDRKERQDAENALIEELADERIKLIIGLVTKEVTARSERYEKLQESQRNLLQLEEETTAGTLARIGNNLDKFFKENEQTLEMGGDAFTQLFKDYLEGIIDIGDLTEEEMNLLNQLFIKFQDMLDKELQTRADKQQKTTEDKFKKFQDNLLSNIQAFQVGLQAVQQTVSDYYNFQFEQLEKRNKRIQETIVGDSERANQLRLEADKAYTAERERLEKQQAKVSLRLSLAQTIANVAQAVAQSLSNPILAGVVAAAGVGQIAIITQQIQAVDSYRRGGKIRKMEGGGLVVGPSHEEGGVKFQGGGIELEGNEAVINRASTLRYQDILNSINISGGGRPIMNTGFDDSRIVEAIAKQRQTPIRAYVVESDITNAQTINKRLELLSQI
jgi:hypothetical protein